MKVGLIQVDGKIPNLALMKLAKWHENNGDDVVFLDISTNKFDRIYGSKIFMGGSGYDLKAKLPDDIEEAVPDYDKFNLDHSIGFTSRGCIRNCEFCIVREKEGFIKETETKWITKNKVLLLDNNFFASPKWKEKIEYFIENKFKVCFNQGLDIRLIDDEKAELLSKVDYKDDQFRVKRLYFAWDNIEDEENIFKGIRILLNHNIKPNHLMFYIIVNFNSTIDHDLYRINKIAKLGCKPYVMIYNKQNASKKIKDLQKWVNRRYYKIFNFDEFDDRKTRKNKPKDEVNR